MIALRPRTAIVLSSLRDSMIERRPTIVDEALVF
jgi:hypothetical protein